MSYRNPQQHIVSDAQHYQRLQDTISRTTDKTINSIINVQKQRKATLAAKGKELKRLQERSDDRVAKINSTLAQTKQEYPDANIGESYKTLVDEYRALSDGVENSNELNYMGRKYSPSEARARMTELEATIGGTKGSIEELVSQTEDFNVKSSKIGKAGGYYKGNDVSNFHGLQIATKNAPGSKKGIFKGYEENGDLSGFVWQFSDKDGNVVSEISREQLANLNKNNSDILTIIPDQATAYEDIRATVNSVYTVGEKDNKGEVTKNGVEIQKNYLTAYTNGQLNEKNLIKEKLENYSEDSNEVFTQSYSLVNKEQIFNDQTLDGELMGDANAILEGDLDTSSAMALHNTFFQKVNYKSEYFLNNPSITDDDGNVYTSEKNLPDEIKTAIKGSKERTSGVEESDGTEGYVFPDDRALTNEEQNIYRVAYKANYIDTKMPERQAVGKPVKSLIKDKSSEKGLTGNKQFDLDATSKRLTNLVTMFDSLDPKRGFSTVENKRKDVTFNSEFQREINRFGFSFSKPPSENEESEFVILKSDKTAKTKELPSKGLSDLELKQQMYLLDGGNLTDEAYKKLSPKKAEKNQFNIFARDN